MLLVARVRRQVVIPNIMGMVIYQPTLSASGVSPIAEAFCKQLVKAYRVNIFDQLVFQDKDIMVAEPDAHVEESYESLTVKWFDLCVAAGLGDVAKVRAPQRCGQSHLMSFVVWLECPLFPRFNL